MAHRLRKLSSMYIGVLWRTTYFSARIYPSGHSRHQGPNFDLLAATSEWCCESWPTGLMKPVDYITKLLGTIPFDQTFMPANLLFVGQLTNQPRNEASETMPLARVKYILKE